MLIRLLFVLLLTGCSAEDAYNGAFHTGDDDDGHEDVVRDNGPTPTSDGDPSVPPPVPTDPDPEEDTEPTPVPGPTPGPAPEPTPDPEPVPTPPTEPPVPDTPPVEDDPHIPPPDDVNEEDEPPCAGLGWEHPTERVNGVPFDASIEIQAIYILKKREIALIDQYWQQLIPLGDPRLIHIQPGALSYWGEGTAEGCIEYGFYYNVMVVDSDGRHSPLSNTVYAEAP